MVAAASSSPVELVRSPSGPFYPRLPGLRLRPAVHVGIRQRELHGHGIGGAGTPEHRIVGVVVAPFLERFGLIEPVAESTARIPFGDLLVCALEILGRLQMIECQRIGSSAFREDVCELEASGPQRRLGIVDRRGEFADALLGLLVEVDRRSQRTFRHRLGRKTRQPRDLRIGRSQRLTIGDQLLQPHRLVIEQSRQRVGIVRGLRSHRLQHGEQGVHRHALLVRRCGDLAAHQIVHRGHAQKQGAPLALDLRLVSRCRIRRAPEEQGAPQAGIRPRQLVRTGLQVDLFGDHGHHVGQGEPAGAEMFEQRGGIGAVAIRVTVERHLSGRGREADDRAKPLGLPRGSWECDDRSRHAVCGAGRRRAAAVGLLDDGTRREGIVAAGVEQHDADRNGFLKLRQHV